VTELSAAGPSDGTEAGSVLAALHGRGHEIVERVLRENDSRLQSLSAADRRTAESLLLAVAARLLDRHATRLEPAQVELLRELFALPGGADAETLT
jgi:hypothetical protein